MAKLNVLQHELVPEHHLLKKEEEDKTLKELNISKDLLPKISRNDPAVKALEDIHGPLEEGRIIRIIRKSPTAGYSVYYRTIISGDIFR